MSASTFSHARIWVRISVAAAFLALSGAGSALAAPAQRGYELVSPPDTGPSIPNAGSLGATGGWDCFETYLATSDGENVIFTNGSPPEGGASNGIRNLYESHRTDSGWKSESKSATGAQTTYPAGGLCTSPDHQYSTLLTGEAPFEQGTLGQNSSYIRTPEGSYVLVGAGGIGTDPKANIKWISDNGSHVVFTSQKRLEPQAPEGIGSASGAEGEPAVNAVYDRTPLGLRVVSLLPSGLAPSPATESTFYRAASADGTSVVFEVVKNDGSSILYERRGENPAVPIVTSAAVGTYRYAGVSSDGGRVTYVKKGPESPSAFPIRGSIYSFDASTQSSVPVTLGSEAAVVNVSDDGSAIYFTSNEALPGSGENGLGQSAQPASPNLYVWRLPTEEVRYVATVSPADVKGDASAEGDLVEWVRAVARAQQDVNTGRRNATSRTTPDGSVFVFQAHGNITGYDSESHVEIYRYDSASGDLSCISCPPEGTSPASDALLAKNQDGPFEAFADLTRLPNVSVDGHKVFFTTADPLVTGDVNELRDVYAWEDGILSLVSSGKGSLPSLLYAMSANGRDVFFLTADQLVPQDTSPVVSIYDAREGSSGFPLPPPPPSEVLPSPSGPPAEPAGGSEVASGPPNPRPRHVGHCKKHHKTKHCVKKHHRRKGGKSR